jgi:hypothetical protein
VPLGYDVVDRRLTLNQTEAETVREIFRPSFGASRNPRSE